MEFADKSSQTKKKQHNITLNRDIDLNPKE